MTKTVRFPNSTLPLNGARRLEEPEEPVPKNKMGKLLRSLRSDPVRPS